MGNPDAIAAVKRFAPLRGVLAAGYFAFAFAGFFWAQQPRLFWTVMLPLFPLALVVMGFPRWRRLCPIAWSGSWGRRIKNPGHRRVPKWMEEWFFLMAFAFLLAMLTVRLLVTNGDGRFVGGLLLVLALSAAVVNRYYTGKAWCQFFCPVGMVERIYTEPRPLVAGGNSQCVRCSACKKNCPDIDQENAYWKELENPARRRATYAFPGLVLGFYTYYWLRAGDWAAYYDGKWTEVAASVEGLLAPGWFFAPAVPAVIAAPVSLVVFSLGSWLLFTGVERIVRLGKTTDELARHRTLALAAFSAFNLFYLFAGAPVLVQLPGGARIAGFAAAAVGTLFLAHRWRRSRDSFLHDKAAIKAMRTWPFDEPMPDTLEEVFISLKALERAHEHNDAVYLEILRELLSDGIVSPEEIASLEPVRLQLGVTKKEHEKILAEVLAEHPADPEEAPSIEQRAQRDGHRNEVEAALAGGAETHELVQIGRSHGLHEDDHTAAMNDILG